MAALVAQHIDTIEMLEVCSLVLVENVHLQAEVSPGYYSLLRWKIFSGKPTSVREELPRSL